MTRPPGAPNDGPATTASSLAESPEALGQDLGGDAPIGLSAEDAAALQAVRAHALALETHAATVCRA